MPKHVLITANAAWNIWNFRRPLVDALIADGQQVTIAAPADATVPDIERLGCRFVHLEMNVKGMNPLDNMQLLRRFRALFRSERPDIVLSYTIKNNIFGAMAARSAGVPFLPNVTGLGTAFLSGHLVRSVTVLLYRWAFRKLPIVFFQNNDDRGLFIENEIVHPSQGLVLPGSGIDLNKFAPAKMPEGGAPVTFLMIARMLRDKGVHEFVQAARLTKANHPDTRFQLLGAVGSENRSAISRETLDDWISEGVIDYLGTADDVRQSIAAASCVVLPSYREGAPRTLIEAAAMARPVIATDVPGCRAVLEDGVTGLLCEVKSAKSLSEAIAHFLSLDDGAWAAMGLAGRAKMEREFDEKIVIDAYRSALAVVIAKRA